MMRYFTKVPGGFKIFNIDACETCGSLITAANVLSTPGPAPELRRLGMVELHSLPNAGYHSEARGVEVCPHCDHD